MNTDISACGAIKEKKDKAEITQKCKLRYECKRFSVHLASTSKQQSYITAQFQDDNTCEMKKDL